MCGLDALYISTPSWYGLHSTCSKVIIIESVTGQSIREACLSSILQRCLGRGTGTSWP